MEREPLFLRDIGVEAWKRLRAAALGSRSRDARPVQRAPLEHDALLRAWSRAASLGAPDEGPGDEELLLRGETLAVRTEPLEALWASAPAAVERALGLPSLRDHVLLFADVDGLVLRTVGGGAFADDARRLRLIEGAAWSESARGTNAIGTAIVEGRPTAVEGLAHYGRRYRELVCYAAPVRDAAGRIVAVLDATSSRRVSHDAGAQVLDAVSRTAHAIEDVLRLRAYASAGHAVTRVLTRSLERIGCPVLLVEPPGRIGRSNERARVELGLGDGSLEDHLHLAWDDLAREALAPSTGGMLVEERASRRSWRVKAEPIEAADGTLLAVLAFLERASSGSASTASELGPYSAFAPIFGEDPEMRAAIELARRVAPSDLPVMLLAETGSGKELFANAIHAASKRARGPFVALNCGSLAPTLLESELFGHAPGAFTGASPRGRTGLLHAASGGTLFLDEIGEMPLSMQTSLLRVLESGTYLRVGETRESRADVRVVCATCRDLPAMVRAGTFRTDLYYRLKGVVLRIPSLARRRDRVALARHLLARAGDTRSLSPAFVRFVESHPWPGNVRELRTVLDVARVLAGDAHELDVAHLPPDLEATPLGGGTDREPAAGTELATVEASLVSRALDELGGNVSAVARRLGIARSTVYRMVRRYGLEQG